LKPAIRHSPEVENIKPQIESLGCRVPIQQTNVCKIPEIDAMVNESVSAMKCFQHPCRIFKIR
jgi:hypothetical protein